MIPVCLPPGLPARLLASLSSDEHGCWLWRGATTTSGYPVATMDWQQQALQRSFFAAQYGLHRDAIRVRACERSRLCLNPAHLRRARAQTVAARPRRVSRHSWIPGVPARIADQIIPEPNSGCWLWFGAVNRVSGYGHTYVTVGGTRHVAGPHRLVYVLLRMPELVSFGEWLPRSLHIHHDVCHVRVCCNPDHLLVKTAVRHASDHRRQEWSEGRGWGSPEARAKGIATRVQNNAARRAALAERAA